MNHAERLEAEHVIRKLTGIPTGMNVSPQRYIRHLFKFFDREQNQDKAPPEGGRKNYLLTEYIRNYGGDK